MRKHSLNRNFTWRQSNRTPTLLSAAQMRAYSEIGGFVLEDVFSAEEVAALTAELDPLEAAANAALADLAAGQPSIAQQDRIVFQAHVVQRSVMARRFAQHTKMVALCEDLLGAGVRLYWDQLVYKRPGTAADFPWHQDNGYTYVEPQQYLTCWVALTDANPANGCPWIAPGWHRQGTLAHKWTELGFRCFATEPEDAMALPVKAGSVAVFSSLTPHRTGANLTDTTRKAYILQYAPDGARVFPRDGEASLADDPDRQFMVVPADD